ncbi:hypothetical protein RB595_006426 [Gaeumannomyces hyphopodioides]
MASTSDYKRFLGEKILTEDQVVTYRYLSRALGIHVNMSKQMLYEFHKSQNDRKSGSVHATYLMYGVKRAAEQSTQAGDGDVEMAEEPSEHVPTYTLSIAKEEDLSDCLALYDHVSSIHVYSIGPSPAKDLQLLSESSRQVLDMSADEDSLETNRKYGAISNPHARRRERKGAAPIPKPAAAGPAGIAKKAMPARPAASAAAGEAAKEEAKAKAPPASSPFVRAAAKQDTKSSQTPSSSAAATPSDKKPAPSLKRGGSGIMQAFAKAGAAKPKAKAAAPAAESSAMSDDGEDDGEALPAPKQAPDSGNNNRNERKEALKRMMEEEDDADNAAEEEEEDENERADTPMEEPEEEALAPAPKPEEPAEVVSAITGDGRRRGRRRVMTKKQIMDDQGYLVTINEPGWESFSEDEAPPKATSSAKPPAPATAAKPKKVAPKGQGNIMSFFSKKA